MKVISFESARARRSSGGDNDSEVLDDLPTLEDLLPSSVRRPGELHEFVRLDPTLGRRVAEYAADAGLQPDVAATLALESGRALAHLADCGIDQPRYLLAQRAKGVGISRRLSAADATYVRSLTAGRGKTCGAIARLHSLALPVRLLPHFDEDALAAALDRIDIDEAVHWETASLISGCSLTEWAFAETLSMRS